MAVTKISSCRYEKSSFITLPLEELGFDPLQQGDCIRPFGASAIPFEEGFGYLVLLSYLSLVFLGLGIIAALVALRLYKMVDIAKRKETKETAKKRRPIVDKLREKEAELERHKKIVSGVS